MYNTRSVVYKNDVRIRTYFFFVKECSLFSMMWTIRFVKCIFVEYACIHLYSEVDLLRVQQVHVLNFVAFVFLLLCKDRQNTSFLLRLALQYVFCDTQNSFGFFF